MKILNKEQIQQADAYTIANEPVKSIDLMERASGAFVDIFSSFFEADNPVKVFAGKGNNGGDGLAISRLLLDRGYDVTTYVVQFTEKASDDFQTNRKRLEEYQQADLVDLYEDTALPGFHEDEVAIDAMWGSGLTRPIEGFARNIIQAINDSLCYVVAVDIPSGVYCDAINPDHLKIRASYTYTFQVPKLAFFFPENQDYTGEFKVLNIGLEQHFIADQSTPYHFTTQKEAQALLKRRKKFQHKGHFGHAMVMAGSYGKIGAALISAKACLRAGSGLLTVYTPACGYEPVQGALPEAMVKTDLHHDIISDLPDNLESLDVIGIGPGIGQDQQTLNAFTRLLETWQGKMVFDADALNLLAQQPQLMDKLPEQVILTPHPGEFARLKGKSEHSVAQLEQLKALAEEKQLVVILKGAHSAVGLPNGEVYFNEPGNPGMATAGCGDALTGILTALLGQGYDPAEAAILGVYLHGLAGDYASSEKGHEGLITSDLISHIPEAYKALYKKTKIE